MATVERWTPPDAFDGIKPADTLAVQRAVDGLEEPRSDAQAVNWVGHAVAEVLGLDADDDSKRIKAMLKDWTKSGVFRKEARICADRKEHPVIVVGEWINDV